MGAQSTRETLAARARAAEEMAFESIWVVDHIAIPPDDAESSGGRYLDTLTTLAWLAGIAELLDRYRGLGVDRFACGIRYDTIADYRARLELPRRALDR
jgi:hypothetical protein